MAKLPKQPPETASRDSRPELALPQNGERKLPERKGANNVRLCPRFSDSVMTGKGSFMDILNIMKGTSIGMLGLGALWVGAQFHPLVWPVSLSAGAVGTTGVVAYSIHKAKAETKRSKAKKKGGAK